MQTLVLDRRGIELDAQEGRLLVRHPDPSRSLTLAVHQLQQVLVLSPITLSSRVITLLAKHEVACLFADGSGSLPMITPLPRAHGRRIIGQVAIATTTALQQGQAQQLVQTKVRRQQEWLARHDTQAGEALSTLVDKLLDGELPLPTLLGLEGTAAKIVWQSFARHLPSNLSFTGRNRRPPRDPVNSILSLSATLAEREAAMALRVSGLDPFLGIFHAPRAGRESLAWDMVELVRPQLEEWTFLDFHSGRLDSEHFSTHPVKGCTLVKSGRTVWYALWAQRRELVRRYLLGIARQWATHAESYGVSAGVDSGK